jgi:hypothetical protein
MPVSRTESDALFLEPAYDPVPDIAFDGGLRFIAVHLVE